MDFREQSQRDVVFTPFMLRVRATVETELKERTVLHVEPSVPEAIAVTIFEWFELRTLAEHVLSEANAMLADDAERIQLVDEYGTDELAFTISWRDRSVRLAVHEDAGRTAHIQTTESGWTGHDRYSADTKPASDQFLEDLAVALLSQASSEVQVDEPTKEEQ